LAAWYGSGTAWELNGMCETYRDIYAIFQTDIPFFILAANYEIIGGMMLERKTEVF
jgi:hypothetical protein